MTDPDNLGKRLYPFGEIKYRGKPILPDVDAGVSTMNVEHFYKGSFGLTASRRHACLFMGYWCWRNFREHPLDIRRYLQLKWRRRHATN